MITLKNKIMKLFKRLFKRKPKVESALYYLGGEILFNRKQLVDFATKMKKKDKGWKDIISHADVENFIEDLKK